VVVVVIEILVAVLKVVPVMVKVVAEERVQAEKVEVGTNCECDRLKLI
jgi:hypothetical protein